MKTSSLCIRSCSHVVNGKTFKIDNFRYSWWQMEMTPYGYKTTLYSRIRFICTINGKTTIKEGSVDPRSKKKFPCTECSFSGRCDEKVYDYNFPALLLIDEEEQP